jgi:hypothetical protein
MVDFQSIFGLWGAPLLPPHNAAWSTAPHLSVPPFPYPVARVDSKCEPGTETESETETGTPFEPGE